MIRAFTASDLDAVMGIWLETNRQAHHFIPGDYWQAHYPSVRAALPQAEVSVYEDDESHQILGFIGLTDDYIAGLFVDGAAQSKGIGKQLLDHAKARKPALYLRVYRKNVRAVSFYQREQFFIQSEAVDATAGEAEFLMCWRSLIPHSQKSHKACPVL